MKPGKPKVSCHFSLNRAPRAGMTGNLSPLVGNRQSRELSDRLLFMF